MAMEHKGIDALDASTWESNSLFLADVYAVLAQELGQEDSGTVNIIASTLREHATEEGQFYTLYNTPRQVSLQSDLAVIQFGLLGIQVAGFERALAHHFALRIAASQAIRRFLSSSTPSPTHIILDEASQVLVDEYMVSTVVKMVSTLPAFGVTLHLAFQDAHALVRADRFGQSGRDGAQSFNTLLGVLGTQWLFFQAPASAHEVGEHLELSREEVTLLSRLKVGEAVLVLPDQQHLPLRVLVPPPWMPAFETDMTSMKRNLTEAMETATIRERGG